MEQGWDRERAASFAWTSTAFPMLTGTLVTAIGFIPIGLANSAVGEYAGGIFWVVGIALVASWFVAVIFTPYLGVRLLPDVKHRKQHADPNAIYNGRFYRAFRRVLEFCVRRPLIVIAATVAFLGLGLSGFSHVQQQFFPLSERPELFLEMRLAEGSSIEATSKVAREAEGLLKGDDDASSYTTYIGKGSPRFWLGLLPVQPNESFAQMVIVAKDVEARERIKARLEAALSKGALSAARVRVDRFNFGPPVGFPVQFRVIGPDPAKVRDIAYRVRDVMRTDDRVVDPSLDWNEKMPSVTLEVDQARARAMGLTPQDIAQTLQTLIGGVTVTTIRDHEEKVDVVARAIPAERAALDQIDSLTVATRAGVPVPVSQVAHVHFGSEEPIMWRRNRDMAITARADVIDGVQPPDVSTALWPKLKEIRDSLSPGYRIEMGGAIEESQKGNSSIFLLFPIMLLGMLTLLMFQLQNVSRLAIVFFTAPLGIVGASIALNLAHKPFGFVALLGLIALAGMDMRNTVILVDQIESDVRELGLTRGQAIVSATVRRARPVVLTALAAILAMIPLSESAFWGPMAFTIMGGLSVATFLTLLVLPSIYALAWFRKSLGHSSLRQSRPLLLKSARRAVRRRFAAGDAFARRIIKLQGVCAMFTDWALASFHHLAIFTLAATLAADNPAVPLDDRYRRAIGCQPARADRTQAYGVAAAKVVIVGVLARHLGRQGLPILRGEPCLLDQDAFVSHRRPAVDRADAGGISRLGLEAHCPRRRLGVFRPDVGGGGADADDLVDRGGGVSGDPRRGGGDGAGVWARVVEAKAMLRRARCGAR